MKILYIANMAKRGSPLGYCPNWLWIAETFKELGHQIKCLNEAGIYPRDVINELEKGYDLILTEEARLCGDFKNAGDHDEIIGLFRPVMEKAKVPIVAWMTNIFFTIVRREIQLKQNPIFKADIVFTTDGGHQKEFEELGINHVCLRQGVYQKEACLGKSIYPTKAEIGFVGSVYEHIWPYRKELVDFLKKTYGTKFQHFGQDGSVRHDELNNLCATLKIVVGDSVYSPHYWSNRIYEIIGRGGFFIHPNTPGLDKEFKPYKHYVPYKYGDFNNLKRVIDYYLLHKEERESIRLAGFEYCRKHHTYLDRVKTMLRILKERKLI